jgi:tetratricopeptide (TPR) repeat protein
LSHGDLAAAATDFAAAHKSAPHYADPLKGWGDLLARQGDWKGALAKYDEALQYAPNWALLQQARGVVAEKAK